jgi:hypothetical protein
MKALSLTFQGDLLFKCLGVLVNEFGLRKLDKEGFSLLDFMVMALDVRCGLMFSEYFEIILKLDLGLR